MPRAFLPQPVAAGDEREQALDNTAYTFQPQPSTEPPRSSVEKLGLPTQDRTPKLEARRASKYTERHCTGRNAANYGSIRTETQRVTQYSRAMALAATKSTLKEPSLNKKPSMHILTSDILQYKTDYTLLEQNINGLLARSRKGSLAGRELGSSLSIS